MPELVLLMLLPRRSQRNLALAWALAGVCSMHHIGHMLHALGLHEYAHTGFMTALGAHEVRACFCVVG